eukprot:scaffold32552_cov52-Phaeocystis_antarctica.AAC.2
MHIVPSSVIRVSCMRRTWLGAWGMTRGWARGGRGAVGAGAGCGAHHCAEELERGVAIALFIIEQPQVAVRCRPAWREEQRLAVGARRALVVLALQRRAVSIEVERVIRHEAHCLLVRRRRLRLPALGGA